MAMPVASTPRTDPSHAMLHKFHINAKAFGAVGDNTADDTAALQAAINAAGVQGSAINGSNGGPAICYIPSGNYKITSPLSLDGIEAVRIVGSLGNDADASPGIWRKSGVRLYANFNGSVISRTDTNAKMVRIEDVGIQNDHATGTGITLTGVQAPGGVYNCDIRSHIGINMPSNIFNVSIQDCTIVWGQGNDPGSRGVTGLAAHATFRNLDINGYERGLETGSASTFIGGRVEFCFQGIHIGHSGFSGSGLITGISMEANDTGIYAETMAGMTIAGCGIFGSVGAPSGSSDYAIDIQECFGGTILNVIEAGSHTANFIRTQGFAGQGNINNLTLIGNRGTTASSFGDLAPVVRINNTGSGLEDVTKAPVVATGSLPAAATQQNGRVIIEDNGTGDRNLIIYAGGQRFRIDGGSAF